MGRNFTQEEWAIFAKVDEICLREDIMRVASDIFDCELTDEQLDAVVEIYNDTESMEIAKKTTIENAIERVICDRKENK